MDEPIDLNARRGERVPELGEWLIRMPMDSDEIIFRNQAVLDEYVAGSRAERDALRDAITALADKWDWDNSGSMDVIPMDCIHGPEAAAALRSLLDGDA